MVMGSWLPPFGIAFTADLLGAGFSLVASFVGLVCCLFSIRDIGTTGRRYGFYPFLMLMMAGVSGAFLTGDIFNLYVWFEVFVISSFVLMILGSERAQLDGAMKYAILNLVATTLFLMSSLGLGLLISTISQTQQQAMMTAFFIIFPAMLLSGFAFPIENMPEPAQWLTLLNPLRYYMVIIRGLFLKDVGIDILWPQLAALGGLGVALLALAVRRFHKTLA